MLWFAEPWGPSCFGALGKCLVCLVVKAGPACEYFALFLSHFTGNDGEVIANLPRGNYSLTVEATSIDNNALMASEVLSPVFLFGPDIVEGQSAAGIHVMYEILKFMY